MDICVIGLGKLGAPLAAVLAARGHRVVGVDQAPLVQALNAGRAPVQEPGLQALIDRCAGRLRATERHEAAVQGAEVSFVIVPTPSDQEGRFSNRFVIEAVQAVGRALRGQDRYHVVVITSTVMPGSTDGEIRQALEAASGRKVGDSLGLAYNPEFIALGSVVRDLENPDMILIGQSDARAGDVVAAVFRQAGLTAPIERMNLVNAELTKLSVNAFVTAKISFANMMAEICEGFTGADVGVVSQALGRDSRIGPKYLKGALGYGGPCFPRDTVAFARLAEDVGAEADMALAAEAINRRQTGRLLVLARRHLQPGQGFAVLGLAYKPDTPVVEQSQGLMLAAALAEAGVAVTVHDPLALEAAREVLKGSVSYAEGVAEAVGGAGLVVVATPDPAYAAAGELILRPGAAVIDCWRLFADPRGATLIHPGRGDG